MLIQSFQNSKIIELLEKEGIAFAVADYMDKDFNLHWGFKESYEWMKHQMIKRGIYPQHHDDDLFWGWAYSGDRGKKQVDLRVRRHQNKGLYLLDIEKSEKDLLLSDFDFWHFVLNYWPLSTSLKEEKYWDKVSSINNFYIEKPIKDLFIHEQLSQSWNSIFELEFKDNAFYYKLHKLKQKYLNIYKQKILVQATFWSIKLEEVKNIRFIK